MIKNIVYHILFKEPGAINNSTVDLSPAILQIDDTAKELLIQLLSKYKGKAGKGYGKFDDDTLNFPTSTLLKNYIEQNDFYQTTCQMMTILEKEINTQSGAKGGKVVFIHYEELNKEYFLVTLLSDKVGLKAQNWGLTQEDVLNIEHMRFAGRINLSLWLNPDNQLRYISFLKGERVVADYFKKFIGCNDAVMANAETATLVEYVKRFANSKELELGKKNSLFLKAQLFLREISDAEESYFSLQAFANHVWPEEPDKLIECFEEYGNVDGKYISDGFKPDKGALKKLTVHSFRTKHRSLSFDDEAVKLGEVTVDPINKTVTYHNLPQSLFGNYAEETEE